MTDTKDQILFTALKLILQKGYGKVTMSELVEATGLSKGAFYHYFTSKDQIYQETLQKYFFSYMETFELSFDAQKKFQDNLSHILELFIELSKEIENLVGPENHMTSYYQTILEASIRLPGFKSKIAHYYQSYIETLSDGIRKAQENGEVRKDLEPVILSRHICSLMEGIMLVYSFQPNEKDIEKYFNDIFFQFLELIKNNSLNEKK